MAYAIFSLKKSVIFCLGFVGSVSLFILLLFSDSSRADKLIVSQEISHEKQSVIDFVPEACGNEQVFVLLRLRGKAAYSLYENADCLKIVPWSLLQGNVVVQSFESGDPERGYPHGICRFRKVDIDPGRLYSLKTESGFQEKYVEGLTAEVWCAGTDKDPYSGLVLGLFIGLGSIFFAVVFLVLLTLQLIAFFSRGVPLPEKIDLS